MAIVSLVGSVAGYFVHDKKVPHKSTLDKIKTFILSIVTSMFISYVIYEISKYFFHADGISVAIAGFVSFTGTDFSVAIEKALLDFIDRKFKSL